MKKKNSKQRDNMKLRQKKRKNHASNYYSDCVRKERIISALKEKFTLDKLANKMGLR